MQRDENRKTKYLSFSRSTSTRGPRIKITDATHAPNSLSTITLWAKLAAKVANVEVDASIERGELPVENSLNKCLTGQDLAGRFDKRA